MDARCLALCCLVLIILSLANPLQAAEPVLKPLVPGEPLPFMVVDFVKSPSTSHCGCPSIMLKNRKNRGVVIWSRGQAEMACELAQDLDDKFDDRKKTSAFVIFFSAKDQPKLEEAPKTNLKNFYVSLPRGSSNSSLNRYDLKPSHELFVYLVDVDKIHAAWSCSSTEFTPEFRRSIVQAASEFTQPVAEKNATDQP